MNSSSNRNLTRRDFLSRAAAAAVALTLPIPAFAQDKKIPLGVQLYSIGDACKADFPGSLKVVSEIGYRGVEFAGYWGRSADDLRKMLDDDGLVACGTHTGYETVHGDALKKTIEFNHTIGNRFLIVPYQECASADDWKKHADEFNAIAETLKPENMRIGYHSHQHDFNKFDGEYSWEIFGRATSPDVILQLDTSNCADAKVDPLAELKKFPGRTRSIHIKPNGAGDEAVIGEDKLPWTEIFGWCQNQGGTEWFVVEHESSKDPMNTIRRTFAALKPFGIS